METIQKQNSSVAPICDRWRHENTFDCNCWFFCFCFIRILVGAPKDNITDPSALPVVREFVRPGVVYQCPITTSSHDCSDVKIDRECKLFFIFFILC